MHEQMRKPAPRIVDDVLRSPGKPLDPVTRAWAEPRFGHDFSRVRVHADGTAAASAAQLRAHAYTAGPHIAFGEGRYRPDSEAGMRLLAHELTHVGQQTRALSARALSARALSDGAALEADAHANSASSLHAPTPRRSPSPQQPAGVQRFGEEEHRSLGNTATNSATYDIGTPSHPLPLTHGDLIMLSGDWFLSDDLFDFAAVEGKSGTRLRSQDEIITALQMNAGKKDPRFLSGGIWFGFTPSERVKKEVEERFNTLAAANDPHFAAPKGRDAAGKARPATLGSAGSTYRALHVAALGVAYAAGRVNGPAAPALAREAAAQHYLTDAFSAGHLRTPIELIRAYWKNRYPLFFENLMHKIALDTAIRMNDIDTNITTVAGSVAAMYRRITTRIATIRATLPEITLGDLLALVHHDADNLLGVEVEGGGRMFGDSHLDDPSKDNVTRPRAQAAILAGVDDVNQAHALGTAGGVALDETALIAQVLSVTKAPAPEFQAEAMLPKPLASAPAQQWQAPDFETLWKTKRTTGKSAATIGDWIAWELQPGRTIRGRLDGLASKFPVAEDPFGVGNVHPRRSYLEGFVANMVRDPRKGLLSIIHWAPDYGLSWDDKDNIAVESGQALDRPARPGGRSRLEGMTPQARVKYVNELIGGSVNADEEELVLRIFATAPPNHRPWMYHSIEKHPWTGKIINGGLFDPDDELWNALTKPRIKRLEALINEGKP